MGKYNLSGFDTSKVTDMSYIFAKKNDNYDYGGYYSTLKEFYYRTKKIKSKKDFDCHLVRVEFDGNYYIEAK